MSLHDKDIISFINYRIERAKETVGEAESNLDLNYFNLTVNRIYYAMFYSAEALLLTKDISSSKHSGVRSFFHKDFIKTGLVDMKYGEFYDEMFNKREAGDYEVRPVKFTKEEVRRWLDNSKEFVAEINKLTLRLINGNKNKK